MQEFIYTLLGTLVGALLAFAVALFMARNQEVRGALRDLYYDKVDAVYDLVAESWDRVRLDKIPVDSERLAEISKKMSILAKAATVGRREDWETTAWLSKRARALQDCDENLSENAQLECQKWLLRQIVKFLADYNHRLGERLRSPVRMWFMFMPWRHRLPEFNLPVRPWNGATHARRRE